MTAEQLAAKVAMRKNLASLSFSEKIKILEKLRAREEAIAASGLRKTRPPNGKVSKETSR